MTNQYKTVEWKEFHEIKSRIWQLNQCCYPGCKNPAAHLHHSDYKNRNGKVLIGELDILGENVFPLCKFHHGLKSHQSQDPNQALEQAHSPINYHSTGRLGEGYNYDRYKLKLMIGFEAILKTIHQKSLDQYADWCISLAKLRAEIKRLQKKLGDNV